MLLWQQNMHDFHDALYSEVRWDIARVAFLYTMFVYVLFFLPLVVSHIRQDSSVTTITICPESAPVLFMHNRATGAGKLATKKACYKKGTVEQKVRQKKNKQKKTELLPLKKNNVSQKNEPSKKEATKKTVSKSIERIEKKESKKKIIVPKSQLQKKMDLSEPELPKKAEMKSSKNVPEPQEEIEEKKVEKELEEVVIGVSDENQDEEGYDAQTKSHMALSNAIARVWRAPCVKIQRPTHAIIQIDVQGKALHVELEQKSGVHIHDIESRAAALRAEYPREFWGKKIRIIFGD